MHARLLRAIPCYIDRIGFRLFSLCALSGLSSGSRFAKMRLLLSIARLFMLSCLVASVAGAQQLVKGEVLLHATWILDHASLKNSLPCNIQLSSSMQLDLLFRYLAGFAINCRLGEKLHSGERLVILVRVTPEFGKPTILLEYFDIPQVQPHSQSGFDAPLSKLEVRTSGGFAMGSGRYSLEVVLADGQGHMCRARKKLKPADARGAGNIPVVLQPGAVAPLVDARWNGSLAAKGQRLTVLLNAHGRFGTARLQAWDRAILLQSLVTLLNQLPCKSVNLVAFNLDEQQQVLSLDKFDADGFSKLERALEQIDFATIPYQALKKGSWTSFLVGLAQRESSSKEPPDDIIFLGAGGSHAWEKLPRDMTRDIEISKAHFFYFELFPYIGSAPDGVEQLTRDMHGTVFAISSPEMLAQAIKKTLALTAAPAE